MNVSRRLCQTMSILPICHWGSLTGKIVGVLPHKRLATDDQSFAFKAVSVETSSFVPPWKISENVATSEEQLQFIVIIIIIRALR